jgi:hypothetical protein
MRSLKNTVLSFTCLSLLFLTGQSRAAPAVAVNLLSGWNSINKTVLQNDVTLLAADNMQGRLSLTKGDDDAIQWIASQFKTAGLRPAAGESYLQSVPLIQFVPDRKQSYLSLDQNGEKNKWLKPDVYTEFHDDITVTGQVVFAGFGITAPDLHYDDYKNIDVRGKIVLIFEHEPQELNATSIFNGKANTPYAINRVKALNAEAHGAIAVIIAPEPNRQHPSNLERFMRIGGSVTRATPVPSQALANDTLHIPIAIISDAIANKIAGKTLSLSKLQTKIDGDLKPRSQSIPDTKITLHDQNLSRITGTSYNVVGLLEGNDPALKNETIIISAHHDHDGMSEDQIWHGADDNASGIAGVVSLANAFMINTQAAAGLQPKRSILFVVFAAEERGLLGAFYMAAHPLRPLATTRALINFDMIGRNEEASAQTKGIIDIPVDTSNRLNLIGSHYSPDYKKAVIQQNQFTGLILDDRFDNESALNAFFRSDQFPFVLQHVPAFWWFTGFHPDYHHVTDTADKINYVKMKNILRLAYLTGYEFTNEKVTPGFINNPKPKI